MVLHLIQGDLQPEIDALLLLKAEYKELTGTEYKPPSIGNQRKGKGQKNEIQPQERQKKIPDGKKEISQDKTDGGMKKITRLGLEAKKEESLHDWYTQVRSLKIINVASSWKDLCSVFYSFTNFYCPRLPRSQNDKAGNL